MTRFRAIALGLVTTSSACAWLVGIDDHVLRVDVDAGSDGSTSSDAGTGTDASPKLTVLAIGETRPGAIVADDAGVFWIDEPTTNRLGSVRAYYLATKNVADIAKDLANPVGLRLQSPNFPTNVVIFFTDDPPDGGARMFRGRVDLKQSTVWDDDGRSYGAMAAKSPNAFTEALSPSESSIRQTGIYQKTGSCTVYSRDAGARFPALVQDDNFVWFFDGTSIFRFAVPDCGTPKVELFAQNQNVVAIAPGPNILIWVTAEGVLQYLDKASPGGTPTIIATDLVGVGGLVARLGYIWLTLEDAGTVLQFVNGGPRTVIATGQDHPHGITAVLPDPTGPVYWTNRGSGQIMRYDP